MELYTLMYKPETPGEAERMLQTDTNRAFRWITKRGYLETVKWLFTEKHAMCDNYTFKRTCGNGHFETVKWLQSQGVDPLSDDDSPFQRVCEENQMEIAKWLLKLGANHSRRYDYPFRYASKVGHLDVVSWLFFLDREQSKKIRMLIQLNGINSLLDCASKNVFDYDIDYTRVKKNETYYEAVRLENYIEKYKALVIS